MTLRKFHENTGLSLAARQQIAGIASSFNSDPAQKRMALINGIIAEYQFDVRRGLYIPLSSTVKNDKSFVGDIIRDEVLPQTGTNFQFFANPLLLPDDQAAVAPPKLRLTNAGFLIITLEYDPASPEDFEIVLRLCRKDNDLERIDKQLRTFRDYRGYCVVYSGHRSLHFHFIFDTRHLTNAPWDADHAARLASALHTAGVMHCAYEICWDHIEALFSTIVECSCPTDRKMRTATQWRRVPFGIRVHEKPSNLFNFREGDRILQMVIAEQILRRSPNGSVKWLVPAELDAAPKLSVTKSMSLASGRRTVLLDGNLRRLEEACAEAWASEYPKPVRLTRNGPIFSIYFRNSSHDNTPSTIAKGSHAKLLLNGRHPFGENVFHLPDDLTANEWGEYLTSAHCAPSLAPVDPPFSASAHSRDRSKFLESYEASLCRASTDTILAGDGAEIATDARRQIKSAAFQARALIADRPKPSGALGRSDYLLIAPEGVGKTTSHFNMVRAEAFDLAVSANPTNRVQRFACFAFRALEQAYTKAKEIRAHFGADNPVTVQVVKSFWEHYRSACEAAHEKPINREDFVSGTLRGILNQIRDEQPGVYETLEKARRALWDIANFDGGSTVICTTHGMVQNWSYTRTTRAWYHPEFDPEDSEQDIERLRREFALSRIVYDEIERGEFLHVIGHHLFSHLKSAQHRHSNWRNLHRAEREAIHKLNKEYDKNVPGAFEYYDELMRLDLDGFQPIKVDFERIPFGSDNTPLGMYRGSHGKQYYVGFRGWVSSLDAHIAYLTTESLQARIVSKLYGGRLIELDLSKPIPGLHPIQVPLRIDPRATKRKISGLVDELLAADPNQAIIANGLRGRNNTYTFQGMKGANDLKHRNTTIILTMLNTEEYCELNVIGQFLGEQNILRMHYRDLVNQAVGRNQGFRQEGQKTTVICTAKTWRTILDQVNGADGRVFLDFKTAKCLGSG